MARKSRKRKLKTEDVAVASDDNGSLQSMASENETNAVQPLKRSKRGRPPKTNKTGANVESQDESQSLASFQESCNVAEIDYIQTGAEQIPVKTLMEGNNPSEHLVTEVVKIPVKGTIHPAEPLIKVIEKIQTESEQIPVKAINTENDSPEPVNKAVKITAEATIHPFEPLNEVLELENDMTKKENNLSSLKNLEVTPGGLDAPVEPMSKTHAGNKVTSMKDVDGVPAMDEIYEVSSTFHNKNDASVQEHTVENISCDPGVSDKEEKQEVAGLVSKGEITATDEAEAAAPVARKESGLDDKSTCIQLPEAINQAAEMDNSFQNTETNHQDENGNNTDTVDQNNNIESGLDNQQEEHEHLEEACPMTNEDSVIEKIDDNTEESHDTTWDLKPVAENIVQELPSLEEVKTGNIYFDEVTDSVENQENIDEDINDTDSEFTDNASEFSETTTAEGVEKIYIAPTIEVKSENKREMKADQVLHTEEITITVDTVDAPANKEKYVNDMGFMDDGDGENTNVSDMIGEYVDKIIDDLVEPLSQDEGKEASTKSNEFTFGKVIIDDVKTAEPVVTNDGGDRVIKPCFGKGEELLSEKDIKENPALEPAHKLQNKTNFDIEELSQKDNEVVPACGRDEIKSEQEATMEVPKENVSNVTMENEEKMVQNVAINKDQSVRRNVEVTLMSSPFDDITNSQLACIDWNSQFPSDSLQTQKPKSCVVVTAGPKVVQKNPEVVENQAPAFEDGSAILAGMIKEVSQLNKMVLRSNRKMESVRRQRPK